ncbi:MAG: hypothetical protein KGD63_01395 [Candidatus Lokiarchaeota archaeon]|nr:hypothetical protein [Candidatus Lokiarchaeota archaeon]
MIESRKKELEHIREKIVEAIRFSEHYWMIYQKNTFGFSTILNLNFKKSYIEVLLFPNQDVLKKGVPLIQINTPIETEVDFNQILVDPDFDEDGLVSPKKIIKRINELIIQESEYHINVLKEEIDLLNEEFENYPLNDIPFYRKTIIYFPDLVIKLKINFEFYPMRPIFHFSKDLSKIIRLNEYLNTELLKNWNELKPPHIVDTLNHLINLIIKCLKIQNYYKNFQHLTLDNIVIGKKIKKISFRAHRGQSIGFLYKGNSNENIEVSSIKKLFNVICGETKVFSGVISVFGKFLQLTNKKELVNLIHIPDQVDSKLRNMKLKRAIKYNSKITLKKKEKKTSEPNKNQFKQNSIKFNNQLFLKIPLLKGISFLRNFNKKNEHIEKVMEVTGLIGKIKTKVNELTPLDTLLFLIARALFQTPRIIMFSIPKGLMNRLEYERLNKYLELIKKRFHVVILIHGPEIIVSKCEKIVTITGKKVDTGTMTQLLRKIPQSGELISIELNYPNQQDIKKLFELGTAIVIEERKSEKYKLFPKEDPNNLIKKIIHIFGKDLQSFKRYKASLNEFVEFLEIT